MKKLTALFVLLVLSVLVMASCSIFGDNGGSTDAEDPNDFIYSQDSEVKVIAADTEVSNELTTEIHNALALAGAKPQRANASMAESEHEIIIGQTHRDVSKKAYAKLERMDIEDNNHAAYVIYSSGKSIGIAYTHVSACEAAVKVLTEEFIGGDKMRTEVGYLDYKVISILDYYEAIDDEVQNAAWEKLEGAIGEEYGPDIVEALKVLYARYNPDVVEWLANLYDADIGAFYYSNSGRNNLGFLPDIESTNQALGILGSSGMGKWTDVLPEEMILDIGKWAYNLQDPDGFFYHPQWGKDISLSRRSRDLGNGLGLVTGAGLTPKYKSANDQISGVSSGKLTDRLSSSLVVAVSKVIPVSTEIPHLASEEAFLNYLNGLNIYNRSYAPGNEVAAQFDQIIAAGLADVCIDYFTDLQNPENGLWEDQVNYASVNGLLKISAMWAKVPEVFPHAKEALQSAMMAIMSDEAPNSVVVMYNCWYSIRNILDSLKYGTAEDMQLIKETRATLLELAPEAIKKTGEKVVVCQKPDGSFSYGTKYSSSTSQSANVAVPYSYEGDVNGTVLGMTGTIHNIMCALGYESFAVPLFGKAELHRFLTTLDTVGSIIKDDTINVGAAIDFEDIDVGGVSESVMFETPEVAVEGSSLVGAKDPVDSSNMALHLTSVVGNGETVVVPNSVGLEANCYVFEGDFYVSSETQATYFMQVYMGSGYMFTFQIVDGELIIVDSSSSQSDFAVFNTFDTDLSLDEWFNIRVEVYMGTSEEFRVKFYVNDKLAGVTDNYYDFSGKKFTEDIQPNDYFIETRLYAMKNVYVDMYMDNLHVYKIRQSYVSETPEGVNAPNVDVAAKDKVVYTFEDGPFDDMTVYDGAYAVGSTTYNYSANAVRFGVLDGTMALKLRSTGKAAKVKVPMTNRDLGANCGTFGFDIKVVDAAVGDFATIRFYDQNGGEGEIIFSLGLSCITEDGNKYIVVKEMPSGIAGAVLEGVKIPLGKKVNLRVEFFNGEDATLVFIDGIAASASYSLNAGGFKYRPGYASIETSDKVSSTILIDNMTAERVSRSFAEATKPSVDRNTYTYDNLDGVTVNGDAAILDGKLTVRDGATVTLPVNHRSPIISVTTLSTDILIESMEEGGYFDITLTDDEGRGILAFRIVKENGKATVYELTKHGISGNALCKFDFGSGINFTAEFSPAKKLTNIYVNGTAVYVSGTYFDRETLSVKARQLVFSSNSATVKVDNTYAEAVNAIFNMATIENSGNQESGSSTLTFEYSSTTNLPSKITSSLLSPGASLRIEAMLRDSRVQNALSFTTTPGANDTLTFAVTNNTGTSTCTAFEAYLYLDYNYDGTYYQFRMENGYLLSIAAVDGEVVLGDLSNASAVSGRVFGTYPATGVKLGEWFHLRLEYYQGNADNVVIKLYVNGELLGVSNNYYGFNTLEEYYKEPATSVSQAYFYSMGAADGTIYIDDAKLEKINKAPGEYELTIDRNPQP